jgi:metal-responsive CopG/Arc/MetJ family transcriptional regulator
MEYIKTAISVQKSLFEKADSLARQMKVPRSRLFVMALEEYIQRQQSQELLEKINAAYADEPDPAELVLREKSLKAYRETLEDKW